MMTVAAIVSLRNLPLSAEYGLASIFYLGVSALVFFIPIALTTAELATTWPNAGGNYAWVSEAFGKPVGFFAIWMAWMETIAWFPAILAFTAAMLAHLLEPLFPGLLHSQFFYFGVIITVFWGATFVNFLGIETSGWVSSLGVLSGTLIPGVLIIVLGVWWVAMGHPTAIEFSFKALVPEFRLDSMVLWSGILFGLAGVEIAAFHIREAKNPQRDYPRALALAAILILSISILGTLAIAVVVPQADISLLSGVIQAFKVFFDHFSLGWAVPIIACLVLIGSLAGINTWTIGPAKGLLATAEDGFLPAYLKRTNRFNVPTGMLIFQASLGTLLSLVFLWMDSHSAAYWVLTALSAQFTMTQYMLVFASAIRLRYSQSGAKRTFAVPGGKVGMWIVGVVGIVACLIGFLIIYIPPSQLETGDQGLYQGMLFFSFLVLSLFPVLFSLRRKQGREFI